MKKIISILLSLCMVLTIAPISVQGSEKPEITMEYVEGEAIILYETPTSRSGVFSSFQKSVTKDPFAAYECETLMELEAESDEDSTIEKGLSLFSTKSAIEVEPERELRLIKSSKLSTEELIDELENIAGVVYAEPNYIVHAFDTGINSSASVGSLNGDSYTSIENTSEIMATEELSDIESNEAGKDREKPLTIMNTTSPSATGVTEPYYNEQWFFHGENSTNDSYKTSKGIDIEPVWAQISEKNNGKNKNDDVVVAVIDSGVDYNHPDLNMWADGEKISALTSLGGKTYGLNAIDDKAEPMDNNGHGTHCAGIIAAEWNGIGTAGVSGNTKVMACKFIGDKYGNNADAIKCMEYILQAKAAGVPVVAVNNSWGPTWEVTKGEVKKTIGACALVYQSVRVAVDNLGKAGVISTFAAGNNNYNVDDLFNDYSGIGISNYVDNMPSCAIVVGATSIDGKKGYLVKEEHKIYYSNYGKTGVDLFAPGSNILSTYIAREESNDKDSEYAFMDGTSMATPVVAGTVALLSANYDYTPSEILDRITASVDKLDSLKGLCKTEGLLDIYKAVSLEPEITGDVVSGADVTISGKYFGKGTKGKITVKDEGGNTEVTCIVKENGWDGEGGKIEFTIPGEVTRGKKVVTVTTTDGQTCTSIITIDASYTVTYDTRGGSEISETTNINHGAKIDAPEAKPIRYGYKFSGWYKDESYNDEWNFGEDVVIKNTTLYAKWIAKENVKIDGVVVSDKVYDGKSIAYADNDKKITKENELSEEITSIDNLDYKWYKKNSGTENVWEELNEAPKNVGNYKLEVYIPENNETYAGIKNYEFCISPKDVTVKPKNLTIKSGEQTNYELEYQGVVEGEKITLKDGLNAQYSCEYDTASGENSKVKSGSYEIDLTSIKDGDTEIEWKDITNESFKMASESGLISNYNINKKEKGTLTVNALKVSFNTNGGSNIDSQSVNYGELITKPDNPTKEGFTFDEWYKENGFINIWNFSSDTVKEDITLFAKWKANSNAVDGAGGGGGGAAGGGGGAAGGGGGGGGVPMDVTTASIGKETTEGNTTTLVADLKQITKALNKVGNNEALEIEVTSDTISKVEMAEDVVEKIVESGKDISIKAGSITWTIPVEILDTKELSKADNAIITIAEVKSDVKDIIAGPYDFTLAIKDGSTVKEIKTFNKYVERAIEINASQAGKITAAVCIEPDGTLRTVPFKLIKNGSKYSAIISSRTSSVYALLDKKVDFSDTNGLWYEEYAEELGSRMILTGRANGSFDGDAAVTRAEFATIIVRAMGLPMEEASQFNDIDSTYALAGAVGAATKAGIVTGFEDGSFRPNNPITRQEAMLMLQRAAKLTEWTGESVDIEEFGDALDVADWAKDAAMWSVGSGLIKGNNGNLNPTNLITRGETAATVLRLLQQAELV